jgi:hypothetical protein
VVYVNGKVLRTGERVLKHGDQLVVGFSHAFAVQHPKDCLQRRCGDAGPFASTTSCM